MEENGKCGATKAQMIESARRFCDLMEEDEDFSLAQSVAACRELASWLESTSDDEIILASLDCFSLLLERLGDSFRPLLTLTVGPLLTTLGQSSSKTRLAAITLLTNLVEIHTAKEVFDLSMNGFQHDDFRIREGCSLFVLSVLKRLGKHSGMGNLVTSDENGNLAQALVTIAVNDEATNAKMAAIAAICELIKLVGYHARKSFDRCEGGSDHFLRHNMDKIPVKPPVTTKPVSGEWMDDVNQIDMTENEMFARLDTLRYAVSEGGLDPEERIKMLRKLRAIISQHQKTSGTQLWEVISSFYPKFALDQLKFRKLTATTKEICLTIQQICSIPTAPDSLIDETIVPLFALLPRLADSTSPSAETVWNALKMTVRRYQHSKVIRIMLKSNPGTNPQLKEVNTPPVRRRIMSLLESVLTLWEDARPLRKQRAGLVEAINAGIYDADGETRQCARRAWHGLHSHFPTEAADMLRKLTTAQQNLILGKVAESRMASRNGSRANSPGRRPRIRTQPGSRTGSPGRSKAVTASPGRISVSRTAAGSRAGSPGRRLKSAAKTPENRTVSVIRAISSTNINDKKAGLAGLKRLLQQKIAFRTPELKKVLESFKGLLNGRTPLFLTALDTLSEFLLVCGPVLDYPWCNFLVPALTNRAADSSLPGQSLAAVVKARTSAIETLNPTWQLQAASKYITDDLSTPRHKVQILVWVTALAPRIEGGDLQGSEFRMAIIRIAQWGGEITRDNRSTNKSGSQIRKCAHEALKALEKSCKPDFETLLENLPPTTSETCRYLLEASFSKSESKTTSRQGSRIGSRAGSRHTSPSRRPPSRTVRPNGTKSEPNSTTKIPRLQSHLSNITSKTPIPKMRNDSPVSTITPTLSDMKVTTSSPVLQQKTETPSESPIPTGVISKTCSSANLNERSPLDTRPPPSPCRSEEATTDSMSPADIFIDGDSPAPEKLVALESLEPQFLDEMEIGRVLLALEKCLKDKEEGVLQQASFEMVAKIAEQCPRDFQNFTSGLLGTLVELAIDEASEVCALECLDALMMHLPAISLLEPLCEGVNNATNEEIKTIYFSHLISIPLKIKGINDKVLAGGDSKLKDISDTTGWARMAQVSLDAIRANLSSTRKTGCTLLANMSIATKNPAAIDDIVSQLSGAAQKLVISYIKKASS